MNIILKFSVCASKLKSLFFLFIHHCFGVLDKRSNSLLCKFVYIYIIILLEKHKLVHNQITADDKNKLDHHAQPSIIFYYNIQHPNFKYRQMTSSNLFLFFGMYSRLVRRLFNLKNMVILYSKQIIKEMILILFYY